MATTSVLSAVVSKYEGLSSSGFPGSALPRIDFGQAAQVVSGSQLRQPLVVLKDEGRDVQVIDFERNALVVTKFAFEVYANSMADVDTIVTAVRAGFDHGTLGDLTSPKSTHQILPTGEPRMLAAMTDVNGQRMHGAVLRYRVSVLESS